MDSKGAIKKGKRFEKEIAELIEEFGLGEARREIGSGSGKKKGDIFANIPFLLECKNQNVKIQIILNWIDQAKKQAEIGNWDSDKWALVFKDPRKPEHYTIIKTEEFLKLLKRSSEPLVKAPDREMAWQLRRLVNDAKPLIKKLEQYYHDTTKR